MTTESSSKTKKIVVALVAVAVSVLILWGATCALQSTWAESATNSTTTGEQITGEGGCTQCNSPDCEMSSDGNCTCGHGDTDIDNENKSNTDTSGTNEK